MSETEQNSKLVQFNEFFSIEHDFSVNISKLERSELLSFDKFIETIPLPFKIASDIKTLDQSALKPIQGISGIAGHLVEYLNHQAHKIDLLVGYILSQLDDEEQRFQGIEFGGGGLIFSSPQPFELDQIVEARIFLLQENTAVFCLAEIIEVESIEDSFHHKIIFHHIREEDREILVRTSLHRQSKQLQQLAKERNKGKKQ